MNTASPPPGDRFRVASWSGALVRAGDGGRRTHPLVVGEAGRYAPADRGVR
jgi:hypothetical protein